MSPRLAWLIPAVTIALVAVMLPLSWASEDHEGAEVMFGLAFVAYASLGALIASRHPRNPVGWLFAALGLLSAFTETLYVYAARSVEGTGPASGDVTAAAWVSAWVGEPTFVALVILLLLFPDGRFESQRWRHLGMATVALAGVWATALALEPGPLRHLPSVRNPVGVDAIGGLLGPVTATSPFVFFLLVPVGVASVVVRYRHAGVEARQQIKWLAVAGGFAIVAMMTVAVVGLFTDTDSGMGDLVTALLVASAITAFPVGAGIAILRHRLYDIDVFIKGTLVYGSLTAMLIASYLGLVLVLRLAFSPLVGDSDLAARTLEGFAVHARDELDLDALGADVRAVARDTMQPAHVSLWLRQAQR
ncbi:MAG TPA: hypothetical protein VFD59_14080 [Nocardioidaceae bacterium]|nr:hypothetical protein [Nocardioidaceae bacterium]